MAHKIEVELIKVTGVKPGRVRSAFLDKLIERLSNFDREKWDNLIPEAQDWYNTNVKLYNAEKPVKDFDGSTPGGTGDDPAPSTSKKTGAPANDSQAAEGEQSMASSKKKSAAKTAKTSKKTPSKPATKQASARASGGEGARPLIIRMLIKNPNMTTAELCEKLKAKGSKASELSVSAMKSQYRQMVKLLDESGRLKSNHGLLGD